jgi:hypothetical protein
LPVLVIAPREVGADVFATPQQIPGGFLLLGGNVNRSEGAGAIEHGSSKPHGPAS